MSKRLTTVLTALLLTSQSSWSSDFLKGSCVNTRSVLGSIADIQIADGRLIKSGLRQSGKPLVIQLDASSPKALFESIKTFNLLTNDYVMTHGDEIVTPIGRQRFTATETLPSKVQDIVKLVSEKSNIESKLTQDYREYWAQFHSFIDGRELFVEAHSDKVGEVSWEDIFAAHIAAGYPSKEEAKNKGLSFFADFDEGIEHGPDTKEVIAIHSHPPHRLTDSEGRVSYVFDPIFSLGDASTNIAMEDDLQSFGNKAVYSAYIVPIIHNRKQNFVMQWLGTN